MSSTYNSSPKSDDEKWREILWRKEVRGECQKCKVGKIALRTIYGDRSEVIRCLCCKSTEHFLIDMSSTVWDDPKTFPPFMSDEDVRNHKEAWENRYSKGMRW